MKEIVEICKPVDIRSGEVVVIRRVELDIRTETYICPTSHRGSISDVVMPQNHEIADFMGKTYVMNHFYQESDHSASIRRIIVPMDADVSETTERMIVSFQAQLKNFPDLLREFNNSLRDGKIFFVEPKRTN